MAYPSDKLKNKLGVAIVAHLFEVSGPGGSEKKAISFPIYCSRAVLASYSKELLVIFKRQCIVRFLRGCALSKCYLFRMVVNFK